MTLRFIPNGTCDEAKQKNRLIAGYFIPILMATPSCLPDVAPKKNHQVEYVLGFILA